MWVFLVFIAGFFLGAVALAALEALGAYALLQRLNRKISLQKSKLSSPGDPQKDLDPRQSLKYAHNKKGVVWVLEPDKVPKTWLLEKEQKKKKDFYEVVPIRKHAKIRDRFLILVDSDGTHTAVPLVGCLVEAVSATSLCSRKWAKRYPIKVESKSSVIYNGSRTVYVYLETSWEKESWCKALRLASCDDKLRLSWFTKVTEEFHSYLMSLNTGYPSFMKPSSGCNEEMIDRVTRFDGSTSKVRSFWRKLSKRGSKATAENRATPSLGRERSRPFQDPSVASNMAKTLPSVKAPIITEEDHTASSASYSRSQSHASSDGESDEKYSVDDGTLCWNLLISRLFFDVKGNLETKSSVQARIQRTLSNMRIPSYVGEVVCTSLHLGNLPPYIHGIRVLPVDMNDVWMWDVDIEYCGGVVLDIETRIEVRDIDLQKGIGDTNTESSSGGDISSDLLEGFEHYGKQLNLPEGTVHTQEYKEEGDPKLEGSRSTSSSVPTSTPMSKWKAIVNSIAKQVSQVPISLSIRVSSLRGTLRLHIKPPPSDQLWFGFTSMPDIEFELESSVGDHKITSGHIALFLINRFKTAIRDTMVLPNCESVGIPWMLAEKNDWVPKKVAPFMWLNRESTGDNALVSEAFGSLPPKPKAKTEDKKGTTSSNSPESNSEVNRNTGESQHVKPDSSDALASSEKSPTETRRSSEELRSPLLVSHEPKGLQQNGDYISESSQTASRSLINVDRSIEGIDEPKRLGRRARMLDLGKKMSEKLEEKRRHIEEKSKSFVERMRDKAENK
ncbi:unnamed protein product [Linum trigynum]|uniref:SMP-LTD domain-containing protein n=1 Tax=Linum trigynum TaxID=586398 RepID=A0AAV2FWG6_9ROSI